MPSSLPAGTGRAGRAAAGRGAPGAERGAPGEGARSAGRDGHGAPPAAGIAPRSGDGALTLERFGNPALDFCSFRAAEGREGMTFRSILPPAVGELCR